MRCVVNCVYPAQQLGLSRLQSLEQRYNRCTLAIRSMLSRDSLLRGLQPQYDGQIQPGLNRPISPMTPMGPVELSLLFRLHDFNPPLQNVRPYFLSAGRWSLKPITEDATTEIWRQLEGRNCDAVFLAHQGWSERIWLYAGCTKPPQFVVKGERYRENPLPLRHTFGRIERGHNCKTRLQGHEHPLRSRTSATYIEAFLETAMLDIPMLV